MLIHCIFILVLAAEKSPTSQATGENFDPPYGCTNQVMTDPARFTAIQALNDVRQDVLSGRITDSNNTRLPTAADMYKLAWNCTLEDLAHDMVKDCNNQSKSNPDYALSFRHYGQAALPNQLSSPLTEAIEEWRAQIGAAQWPANQQYNQALNIQDFANMIHAKTTAVGCAEAKCNNKATAACFYNQPELQNGELIYTKGTPCRTAGECTTYQPSTCDNGFCVKGDLPTTGGSSSSETTPSSSSSENTSPSSSSSENTTSGSSSSENTTLSSSSSENTTSGSSSSENTTLSSSSSEDTTSGSTSSEDTTSGSTASGNTTSNSSSSENTTPSGTSSENTTPGSTSSESSSTSSQSTTPSNTSPGNISPENATSGESSPGSTPSTIPTTTLLPTTTTSTTTTTTTSTTTTTNAHKDPSINQICPTNWGVNDKIRNKTLAAHNYRRSELALGRIRKRNGNYYQRARNMIKLKYSCQLEISARDHAVTCRNAPSSPSSRPNIEENVARIPKNSVPDRVEAIRKAITLWWKTGRKEKPIGVALTFKRHHEKSPIRHFTKIAWADTREIGCAVRDCGSSYIAVCHYSPGGNIVGHKIYEAGRPCSRCPPNAKCNEGLCEI